MVSVNLSLPQKASLHFLYLYSGFEQTSQAHSAQLQAQATGIEELHSKVEILQQSSNHGYQNVQQTIQNLQSQVKPGKPSDYLIFVKLI